MEEALAGNQKPRASCRHKDPAHDAASDALSLEIAYAHKKFSKRRERMLFGAGFVRGLSAAKLLPALLTGGYCIPGGRNCIRRLRIKKTDWKWDQLRDDPHFANLTRRLGFTQ
jgi:hypothetical protein